MERDSAGASVPGSQQHLAATMEKDSAGASVRDSQRRLQTPPNAACHRDDTPAPRLAATIDKALGTDEDVNPPPGLAAPQVSEFLVDG